MNKYEGVFIVDSQLSEDAQKKKSEAIQETVKKLDGTIDGIEAWGRKKFSYRIDKKREGVYYLLRFQAQPDAIAKLYKTYRLDESILRVMIVNAKR